MNNDFSKSLLATRDAEKKVERELFDAIDRYDGLDDKAVANIQTTSMIIQDMLTAIRMKIVKLEHDLNTLDKKREEEKK